MGHSGEKYYKKVTTFFLRLGRDGFAVVREMVKSRHLLEKLQESPDFFETEIQMKRIDINVTILYHFCGFL